MLSESSYTQQNTIAKELVDLWIWCNVYPVGQKAVTDWICNLIKTFDSLIHYHKYKCGPIFMKKLEEYLEENIGRAAMA